MTENQQEHTQLPQDLKIIGYGCLILAGILFNLAVFEIASDTYVTATDIEMWIFSAGIPVVVLLSGGILLLYKRIWGRKILYGFSWLICFSFVWALVDYPIARENINMRWMIAVIIVSGYAMFKLDKENDIYLH